MNLFIVAKVEEGDMVWYLEWLIFFFVVLFFWHVFEIVTVIVVWLLIKCIISLASLFWWNPSFWNCGCVYSVQSLPMLLCHLSFLVIITMINQSLALLIWMAKTKLDYTICLWLWEGNVNTHNKNELHSLVCSRHFRSLDYEGDLKELLAHPLEEKKIHQHFISSLSLTEIVLYMRLFFFFNNF